QQLVRDLGIELGEVVDEVEGVPDLVGNACRELPERRELFLADELILRILEVLVRLLELAVHLLELACLFQLDPVALVLRLERLRLQLALPNEGTHTLCVDHPLPLYPIDKYRQHQHYEPDQHVKRPRQPQHDPRRQQGALGRLTVDDGLDHWRPLQLRLNEPGAFLKPNSVLKGYRYLVLPNRMIPDGRKQQGSGEKNSDQMVKSHEKRFGSIRIERPWIIWFPDSLIVYRVLKYERVVSELRQLIILFPKYRST